MRPLALLALGVALSMTAAAQSEVPIPRPELKVGDQWTYRSMDYWTNRVQATGHLRVTLIAANEIHGVITPEGKTDESDSNYDADWNLRSSAILVYDPSRKLLRFPMKVGDKYETAFELVAQRNSPIRAKYTMTVQVMGWEEIEVPAGKFRALKIQADGNFMRLDGPWSGWAKWAFWYVPEVKRWVKETYDDGGVGTRFWRSGFELVRFQVQ